MGCTGLLPCGWNVPLDLQMLALHLLSTAGMACPLQAHCAIGHPPLIHCLLSLQDPSGTAGREMKEEMVKKIEKWQEPPPAKTAKVRLRWVGGDLVVKGAVCVPLRAPNRLC